MPGVVVAKHRRAAFDHAAETARFILLPETSVGYAHEGLRISALLPEGWSISELRSVERFTLSSFVDVHALWYTHESEPGLEFAQLQGLPLHYLQLRRLRP
ncbi:MAG: hypothetical protein R6V86_03260 [Spirochaetia bacterium]